MIYVLTSSKNLLPVRSRLIYRGLKKIPYFSKHDGSLPPSAYRLRVDACNEVLAWVLSKKVFKREKVVEKLKGSYERIGIEPLRGWSARDLYDKELAFLYSVCRYGLGISWQDHPELLTLFRKEEAYDRVYRAVLAGVEPEVAMKEGLGGLTQEGLFRMLRLAVSLVVLNLEPEENLAKVFNKLMERLPSFNTNFYTFMKFYVALRTAERIACGEIKLKEEKEAFKLALCLKMGAPTMAPPDELIRLISKSVFKVNEVKLSRVFAYR